MNLNGSSGFYLKKMLNRLKSHFKQWNKASFVNINNKILELENLMDDYDMIGNLRDLIEGECVARRTMMHQLWTTSRQKESLWLQKSKIQWLKEGDKNTHFFQCTAKARSCRNLIASVMVDGYWVFKLNGIHNTIYDYFRNLFNITQWSQPVF